MNTNYLTIALKNLEMSKQFLNSGDKKTAKLLHDLAQTCLQRHNAMVEMNKRAGKL